MRSAALAELREPTERTAGVPAHRAGAHLVARLLGEASPGLATMLAVALLGGAVAVAFALAVAYYGTIVALATGVDPDNYGIPLVTASADFGGVIALIAAIAALGVTVG